jgi:hypothetical protein
MNVNVDRPWKLISWLAVHVLLSHQVWIRFIQKYSKNKGLFYQCCVLAEFWPWPLTLTPFIWYVGYYPPNIFCILTTIFLKLQTKQVEFLGKNHCLICAVTKWCNNATKYSIWKVLIKKLYMEYYRVCFHCLPNLTCSKLFSTRSDTHEDQSWLTRKNNKLSDRPYATFTPSFKLIWLQLLQKYWVSFTPYIYDNMTLIFDFHLDMLPPMRWLP